MNANPVSPNEYDDQRLAGLTDFRCERCGNRWPYDLLDRATYEKTGRRVDSVNCAYDPPDRSAKDVIAAHAKEEGVLLTAANVEESARRLAEAPSSVILPNLSVLETLTSTAGDWPEPTELTAGGASVVVTITGYNHSSDDVIEYGHAGITDAIAPSRNVAATTTTLTVHASGAVPQGYYDLKFNVNPYRRFFRVV